MSFLEGVLPNPAARVELSLTRDLEFRRSDPRMASRFSGYAYRGGADLVLRHGRFYQGRRIPEQYEHMIGQPNDCTGNALIAATEDPSLRYCEGYYTTGWGAPQVHAWCVAPDGCVVEVTLPTNRPIGSKETGMEFLPPEHWGYYGVTFTTPLVTAHLESGMGLPMLDRSYGEIARAVLPPDAISESHDFPVLKLPYDPNRTELT